ncbi:MAG: FecR domain-containing protein [Chitinophagaceae bacterium]
MKKQEYIEYLIRQHISNAATPAEQSQLMANLHAADYDEEDLLQMLDQIANSSVADKTYDPAYWQPILQQIMETNKAKQIPITRTLIFTMANWRRIAIAASIILAVGISAYFFISTRNGDKSPSIATTTHDVEAPKNTRATITLADGRIIELDSLASGTLATQGNTNVIKNIDGKIVYDAGQVPSTGGDLGEAIVFNTLSNPRGSKVIDMTLSDGSHVWLNAGSSITYPVAFVGNERKVEITGEAYFEVAHLTPALSKGEGGKATPFIVSKGNMEVTVLGTHFNVNAYDDEANIQVTLLEGSVKVRSTINDQRPTIIKPGEQAVLTANGQLSTANHIDLDEVMAWKNGIFQFEGADIKTVMRQIARWYDVEVEYQGNEVGQHFRGTISRNVPASKLFIMLELTKAVHFEIEGKKIIVKP